MNQAFNPGDLLSGLAANPDLLKNAMQMASALASSGALGGLFNSGSPGTTASAKPPDAPNGAGAGSFVDLLSGLMGAPPRESDRTTDTATVGSALGAAAVPTASRPQKEGESHRPSPPCHQDRVRLLQAVCPFLPDDKREKVYFLIKLLELFSTAEQMGLGRLF